MAEQPKVTILWDDLIEQETKEFGPRLDAAAALLAGALQAAWPRSANYMREKKKKEKKVRYHVVRRARGGKKRGKKRPTADRITVVQGDDHLTRLVVVPFPAGYVEEGWLHVGGAYIPARNIAAEVVERERDRIFAILAGE